MSFSEMGTLATGLYDFEGVRDDNLPFKRGEVITIIEMNDTGWWKGANAQGRVGIFPYNYVEARTEDVHPDFRIVKAITDYEGQSEEFLSFNTGDLITVLKPIDDNWSMGKLHTSAADNQRVKERKVGKFPLSYIEETDDIDDNAEQEENEYAERQKKEKEERARQLQLERQRIEEEKQKAIELEAERLRLEEEKKKELEEQERLERAKRKEAEEKMERSRLIRNRTAKQKALAEAEEMKRQQEAREKEIEEERKRVADEMERMKREMEKFAKEAEEARKRAAKAEEDLIAANAEKQRLAIAKEKKQSKVNEEAQEKMKKRNDLVAQKINQSVTNFRDEDGFSSPPPLVERKKYVKPSRFANLGVAAERCKLCDKPVAFGPSGMKAIGASWHRECFKCATCSKVLRSDWLEHGGYPYCQKCHRAGFSIKGFGFGGAVAGNYR